MKVQEKRTNYLGSRLDGWPRTDHQDLETDGGVTSADSRPHRDRSTTGLAAFSPLNALARSLGDLVRR